MRVTNAPASRKRRKRMLKLAKGFRLRRSSHYRYASDAVDHGMQYAYRDRKAKKRTFRYLWQIRINAAARAAGGCRVIGNTAIAARRPRAPSPLCVRGPAASR